MIHFPFDTPASTPSSPSNTALLASGVDSIELFTRYERDSARS
jgi:hypothetical protein